MESYESYRSKFTKAAETTQFNGATVRLFNGACLTKELYEVLEEIFNLLKIRDTKQINIVQQTSTKISIFLSNDDLDINLRLYNIYVYEPGKNIYEVQKVSGYEKSRGAAFNIWDGMKIRPNQSLELIEEYLRNTFGLEVETWADENDGLKYYKLIG